MTPAHITVQNIPITISSKNADDFICITDMAKAKSSESRAADVIKNWVRSRTTLEFLGTWELLYNPDFKVVEFDHFRMQAGLPMFTLSVGEWIEKTNAIGLYVERGRPQPSKAKPCSAKVTSSRIESTPTRRTSCSTMFARISL